MFVHGLLKVKPEPFDCAVIDTGRKVALGHAPPVLDPGCDSVTSGGVCCLDACQTSCAAIARIGDGTKMADLPSTRAGRLLKSVERFQNDRTTLHSEAESFQEPNKFRSVVLSKE